jgi:hypothetical protein
MRCAWIMAAMLFAGCGDDDPVARLMVDFRFPKSGVPENVLSYNVVARGPFVTQCDTWAFMGENQHESAFRGTLGADVVIDIEGLDVSSSIVVACGSSRPLDLGNAGELAVPIYLGNANAVEAADPELDRARAGHGIAALRDGRVLLAGGTSSASAALLIDPASSTLVELAGPRAVRGHTVTALPDGGALVIGGIDAQGNLLAESWRFDPGTDAFVQLPFDAGVGRRAHTATPLCTRAQPGCSLAGKVLVVGGFDAAGVPSTDAWIVDAQSGDAMPLPYPMDVAEHAAVELENGEVLIAGGRDASDASLSQASIFVPSQSAFRSLEPTGSATAELNIARRSFAAVLAQTGSALILGGQSDLAPTGSIEAFDPEQDGFVIVPVTSGNFQARVDPIAIALPDDRILVASGGQSEIALVSVAEDSVQVAAADGAHDAMMGLAAARLDDNSILLSGGLGSTRQSIFRPCPRTPTRCQ